MAYVDTVSGGSEGSVRAQMPEGGLVPGENTVVYTCPGSNGTTGAVSLCVVVE